MSVYLVLHFATAAIQQQIFQLLHLFSRVVWSATTKVIGALS